MPNSYTQFVGIDVSKMKLDVYETKNKRYSIFSNNKVGIKKLLKAIKPSPDTLVLTDLTGGYENLVSNELVDHGFNVHKAQGRKVRKFTESFGQKAKTDRIDAKMLTIYGDKMQETLRLYQKPSNQLQELVARREQLMEILLKEKNHKEHCNNKTTKHSVNEIIKVLQTQLDFVEAEIEKQIANDKELKEKSKVIGSIKSVGEKTTMVLLATMPELGFANRRQIAALAGLAPFAKDSGSSSGKRKTGVGRAIVKRMLFMCALVAIRNDKTLKAFYEKLVSKGKLKLVAIVAVMRKLLIIINNHCKNFYAQRGLLKE
jgi:transposase